MNGFLRRPVDPAFERKIPVRTPESVFTGRRTALLTIILCLSGLSTLLWAPAVQALPRYTAQYGQSCTLCHVNPTGGGMRSGYASQFLVPEEIAGRGWTEEEAAVFSPQISPNIALGVDLRTLVYQEEEGSGSTLSMQGDLYLDLTLSSGFTAYIEQTQDGAGEVFGVIRGGWLDGYLKAGRFVPDYGWQFADHQMFNRRYLLDPGGSSNPANLFRSGLEIGVSPGMLTATASVLGRSDGQGDNYAGRVMVQENLGPVYLGAGGSVLRQQFGADHHRAAGGFWYLSAGPVTWLGEIDETRQAGRLGKLVAHELTYRVQRGLDFRMIYNYQDPDRAVRDGTRQKYGAGVAYMPRPFFSLLAMANYWKTDPGPQVTEDSHHEGQLVIHFFY